MSICWPVHLFFDTKRCFLTDTVDSQLFFLLEKCLASSPRLLNTWLGSQRGSPLSRMCCLWRSVILGTTLATELLYEPRWCSIHHQYWFVFVCPFRPGGRTQPSQSWLSSSRIVAGGEALWGRTTEVNNQSVRLYWPWKLGLAFLSVNLCVWLWLLRRQHKTWGETVAWWWGWWDGLALGLVVETGSPAFVGVLGWGSCTCGSEGACLFNDSFAFCCLCGCVLFYLCWLVLEDWHPPGSGDCATIWKMTDAAWELLITCITVPH